MTNDNRLDRMNHKRVRSKRIKLIIFLPILFLIIMASAYGAFLYNKAAKTANNSYEAIEGRESSEKRYKKVNPKKDNISVLFMGVDESDVRNFGDAVRTDALILATFNKAGKSVNLVSIPRDSYVHLPFKDDMDKINHAHVFGGVKGTIETVEELFNVPVDYYVKLNFNAFIDVVEALDGITVDVPITFTEMDSLDRKGAIQLEKGIQTLNGEEALALARTRKIDSDIERGKRQQLVMTSIINKAISISSIAKYGDVIEAVGSNMKTNMTFEEMLSFHDYALAGTKLTINSFTLEGQDDYINRIYYYSLNHASVEDISNQLRSHLDISNISNSETEDGPDHPHS
jgi:LCP family protein required for cell wall assembly